MPKVKVALIKLLSVRIQISEVKKNSRSMILERLF